MHTQLDIPIVAVPKTIDNDLASTDRTFGFDTAVQIATEAVDRLHSTAEAHRRVMVEVMGRHAGWIATYSGIAGGADAILIPERPFDTAAVARHLKHRAGIGRTFSVVVVAEGANRWRGQWKSPSRRRISTDGPRLGGVGQYIAAEIERRTGIETRITILWGTMAALRGVEAKPVPSTRRPVRSRPFPTVSMTWRRCSLADQQADSPLVEQTHGVDQVPTCQGQRVSARRPVIRSPCGNPTDRGPGG
jgi:hypothetical protein